MRDWAHSRRLGTPADEAGYVVLRQPPASKLAPKKMNAKKANWASAKIGDEAPELGVRILFDVSRWYPCAEMQFRCQVLPRVDTAETIRAAGLARRATNST